MPKKENEGKKNRIRGFFVRVILIAACVFLVLSPFVLWLLSESSSTFRGNLKDSIREELIREDSKIYRNVVDAIYVLGGSQGSLKLSFKKAAALYHAGISKKILILSRLGKTEYSSLLGRNLRNDEWSILMLEELGVPSNSVEPISIKEEFFGTLSEAKGISRLIKKRGYKSVALISSPYHTHRIKISFENFLQHNNIKVYVQSSDEKGSLGQLLIELIKLKIYEYFLV
jgi:uncharacterized SAM-binding protein YcdF (DUF218 family)